MAQSLGYLALAIDLAGADIGNDSTPEQALSLSLAEYDRNRGELPHMGGFRELLPTRKMVWAVWDTTREKTMREHFPL